MLCSRHNMYAKEPRKPKPGPEGPTELMSFPKELIDQFVKCLLFPFF
jgi:hypothetical protein